ncbi:DUF3238 domain-containing protein [Nocardiopsis gilva]
MITSFGTAIAMAAIAGANPANAETPTPPIDIVDISRDDSSVTLRWKDVPNATEYVAFEEIFKGDISEKELNPAYRGKETRLEIGEMEPGEVTRVRLVAIDEREEVLARSIIRSTTAHANAADDGVTWIADSSGMTARIRVPPPPTGQATRGHALDEGDISTLNGQATVDSDVVTVVDGDYTGEETERYEVAAAPESTHTMRSTKTGNDGETEPGHRWSIEVSPLGENTTGRLEDERRLSERAVSYGTYYKKITWDAFIPDKYVPGPAVCTETLPNAWTKYYKGDGRGMGIPGDPRAETSRIRLNAGATFNSPRFTWEKETGWRFVGWDEPTTNGYTWLGISSLHEKQDDGSMKMVDRARASLDDVTYSNENFTSTSVTSRITSKASDPLCHVFKIFDAPAVDIDITATLSTDGTHRLSGTHDMAPSHQSWIKTATGPLTGETIADPPDFNEYSDAWQNPVEKCVYRFGNVGLEHLALPPIALSPPTHPFNEDCTSK